MSKAKLLRLVALGLLIACPKMIFSSGIERDPLKATAIFDNGQFDAEGFQQRDIQGIQRTIVSMFQSVTIEERLRLTVGIGGLFYYPWPTENIPHKRTRKFATGIREADAVELLGDISDPWGKLQFGAFPFKYNPDAANLGEYMYRSGAYPNYIQTGGGTITDGGGSIINSAQVLNQGINFEVNTFSIKHNFLFTLESSIEPIHDITAAYFFSFKFRNIFEIGGGSLWGHLISSRSSYTTPTGPTVIDPGRKPLNRYQGDSVVFSDTVKNYSNYTFKNTKLMGRVALNLRGIFDSELMGADEGKIYGEVAVLGIKNYPFYYTNVFSRTPFMFGFNLPTFKLLDRLAIEGEYHHLQFADDFEEAYSNGLPLPPLPQGVYAEAVAAHKDPSENQRWKWSIYAKKTIMPGFVTYLQVASDHMRGINYDKAPQPDLITKQPSDWYFLFRIELGI